MRLYAERGFDQTTVAEIAEQAGVTARTFFRYFADKREVLFSGAAELHERLVEAILAAPAEAAPMRAVEVALAAAAALLGTDRAAASRRQSVITAHADLRERELIKMASLAAALAAGLRRRGVGEPDATLAAEAGIVVFRVAFEQWVAAADGPGLAQLITDGAARLSAVTAPSVDDDEPRPVVAQEVVMGDVPAVRSGAREQQQVPGA
jgi:AcrR family transcriptional regulator